MNLQKEVVSQELLIDKRLTSGEHKKAVHQNSSGSSIPSTATGTQDPKYSSNEKKSKVEDGNKLEHSSASDARDEEPPRSERSSDRKDSSKENAYLSEDTIKLEPLLATDVDIILDEDQEPATCEPKVVYLCAKGSTCIKETDVCEGTESFRNHSTGIDRMNLQKELVSQELLIDKRLTSGEHKKVVPRNSSGSPIPSTATGAKDGQLMVFLKEQTPRLECVPRTRLAELKKGRNSTSRRKTDVWEGTKAFRNHSRGSYNLNLKTVVDDKLPVAKVVPMPPSPPDPPNPNI